jgi:hypothetical protein
MLHRLKFKPLAQQFATMAQSYAKKNGEEFHFIAVESEPATTTTTNVVPESAATRRTQYKRQQLQDLKATGIRTILLYSDDMAFDLLETAQLLHELDMLTADFVYILPPHIVPSNSVGDIYGEQTPGSPMDKLLSGSLVFEKMDPFQIVDDDDDDKTNHNDPFWNAWKMQNTSLVDTLNRLRPIPWLRVEADYFQQTQPTMGASYAYDSVIAIGLGACQRQAYRSQNPNEMETNDGQIAIDVDGSQQSEYYASSSLQAPPDFQPSPGFEVIPEYDRVLPPPIETAFTEEAIQERTTTTTTADTTPKRPNGEASCHASLCILSRTEQECILSRTEQE